MFKKPLQLNIIILPECRKIFFIFLSIFLSNQVMANSGNNKAKWYRYYDRNGIANISSSIGPEHIRRGYESLDRNMQVVKVTRPYSAEEDQKSYNMRQQEAQQTAQDQRLKNAYGNSQVAINKRDDYLKKINKQIVLQQIELKKAQKENLSLKQQEQNYSRTKKSIPSDLRDRINFNEQNTSNIKNKIASLQSEYRNTQEQYDIIISRLKKLE